MDPRLLGYHVRYLEPEALRAFLRDSGAAPGRHFLARFDAAQWASAVAAAAGAGALSDDAACALADAVLRVGEPGGFVDVEGEDVDAVARTVGQVVGQALADDAAGQRLLTGGLLDRRGAGRYALGALPLRALGQHLQRPVLDAQRRGAQVGWLSELLNVLESAVLVAARAPEAHLVLVPEWGHPAPRSSTTAPRPSSAPANEDTAEDDDVTDSALDVVALLRQARALHASDLLFVPGAPLLASGPFGRRALSAEPLAAETTRRLAFSFLTDAQVARFERDGALVTGFGVRDLGRYRLSLTRERGLVSGALRLLAARPPALDALGLPPRFLAAVRHLERGLVVIGGTPGSGRSTTLGALSQSLLASGAVLGSVEAPVAFSLQGQAGLSRQVDATEDVGAALAVSALRQGPLDVLALDLADDEAAYELALDAAADGKLVLCTLRGATVTALVHRLVAADARLQRRRLAESLAVVLCQTLVPAEAGDDWELEAEALVPSEALRRHLRALDTMPPPAVLETDGA